MDKKISINNPSDLFNFLAEQAQKLDSKRITVEQAKAQASIAKQMNNIMQFRLDKLKFETQMKATMEELESAQNVNR